MHTVPHRALEQAVRWGLVPRNVSEAVDPPRARRGEARPRRGARPPRSPLRARPHHRHETGRASGPEVGGHRDLERGVIRVRRTLAGAREGVPAFETPKTAKSRRSVPLTPGAIEALRTHRRRQLEEKLRRAAWRDHGLVFTTEAGTPLDRHNRFWATPASRSTPTATSCPAWAGASPPRWGGRSTGPGLSSGGPGSWPGPLRFPAICGTVCSALGRTRTCDPVIRSHVLCPAELRAHRNPYDISREGIAQGAPRGRFWGYTSG